jgi:hypothetical protein
VLHHTISSSSSSSSSSFKNNNVLYIKKAAMKAFDSNLYSNFYYEDFRDLPLTVLEHFEWTHNDEGCFSFIFLCL